MGAQGKLDKDAGSVACCARERLRTPIQRRHALSCDVLQLGCVDHRAVDAHAQIAAATPGHDAPEARAEPAGHPSLERELGRRAALRAHRPDALEHRRLGRTRRRRPRVAFELGVEQIGDQAVMADGAVVSGHAGAVEQRCARGASASRKPSRTVASHSSAVLEDRQGRDPDAAADQDRTASVGGA